MGHEETSDPSMAHNTIKSRSKCSFSPLTAVGGRILSALDRSEKPLDTAKDLIYTTLTINSPILLSLPEGVNFSSIGLRLLSYTVITATSSLWILHLT